MRFTIVPLVLAASSALALASPKYKPQLSRAYGADVVRARQAKVHRDVVDVCASLNNAPLQVKIANGIPPVTIGLINVCLCVSAIESFCKTNIVAEAAIAVAGQTATVTALENLINGAAGHKTCTYPTHAQPICTAGNPCDFSCSDGYTPSPAAFPTSCHCAAPNTECNGVCGYFPHGCGSAVAQPYKKRAKRTTEQRCSGGRSVCGVPEAKGGKGWECVDTLEDKESCGGCITPSPFTLDAFEQGIDCTALPHVASGGVECQSGVCFVHTCAPGFAPSPGHDGCVSVFHYDGKRA